MTDTLAAPSVSVSDPVGTIHALIGLCGRLELPGVLERPRRLLARGEQLAAAARQGRATATRRRAQAMAELVAGDGPVDGEAVAVLLAEVGPWLDPIVGETGVPPAVHVLMDASRACRGHALAALTGESSGLYGRLQGVARDAVGVTAGLPALPAEVWRAHDPASETVRAAGGWVWGELVRQADRFALCHQAGELLRRTGGLGREVLLLPDGAGDLAFCYRRWDLALEPAAQVELRRLPIPLRLRYAVDKGFEPGLWLASDLERPKVAVTRRGPLGFLVPSPLRSG